MECRLVLNNRTDTEISNDDMDGRLHQQLKYYKYRRVPSKNGKAVFYLFFRKEEETYAALRAAKSIREISLVRYYPSNFIDTEPTFRPFPPQHIIDTARYAFRDRLDSFYNVDFFKTFIRRLSEQIMAQNMKMNGAISIVLPMPTMVIQFPADFGLTTGLTIQITQCAVLQTNETKEEKIETQEEKAEIKDEADIKDNINIKDEPYFDFNIDDDDGQNDPNLFQLRFSPISSSNSEYEENDKSSTDSEQDETSERFCAKCMNDILKYVEYLKEGTAFN